MANILPCYINNNGRYNPSISAGSRLNLSESGQEHEMELPQNASKARPSQGRPPIFVDGFPSLAAFIASDGDGTAAIFKRFSRLAARNLLALQSELAELQEQLDAYDAEDQGSQETLQSLRNWEVYKLRDESRLELFRKLKLLMKEYSTVGPLRCRYQLADSYLVPIGEALVMECTIACLEPPERRVVKAFKRNFFHGRPEDLSAFPMLGGHSSTVYDDESDLVAIRASPDTDKLSEFVRNRMGFMFHEARLDASDPLAIQYASGRRITRFVTYLSAAAAALLLFGAILVLHHVRSEDLKLGLVALFTILFALSIALLTNAKRSEIFASTAAYAAVLVVFVSSDFAGPRS